MSNTARFALRIDAVVEVVNQNGVGRGVEDLAATLFRGPQRLLGSFAVGDVAADAEDFGDLAVLVPHRPVGPGDAHAGAVASNVLVFVVFVALRMLAHVANEFGHVASSPFNSRNDGPHDAFAEKLLPGITEEVVREAIGERQIALSVHSQNDAIDALDQIVVLGLGPLEFGPHVNTPCFGRLQRDQAPARVVQLGDQLVRRFRLIVHGRPPRSPR